MQQQNYLTDLLAIKGFYVKGIKKVKEEDIEKVIIEIEREKEEYICSGCCRKVYNRHSSYTQDIRHLHLWKYITIIRFDKVKVRCPDCGVIVEKLDFLDKYARVTNDLSHQAGELSKIMEIKYVSEFQQLNWHTVKEIDKRAIEKACAERDLSGITVLGVDEISVGKGQNYWHMISSFDGPNGPEIIYVGEGRKEEELKPFWKWFGKERAEKITHAVMDMWKGFINSFRNNVSGVKIIYDKFHIMRHLLNALNDVRKAELIKAGEKLKRTLSGKKFILLKKMSRVKGDARVALKHLMSINTRIFKAHLLKESFERLWSYKYKGAAKRFWNN